MEFYLAQALQRAQQDYTLNLLISPGLDALRDHYDSAYHHFLKVLPDEGIQGLAVACQNQVNILSRQGNKAAAAIPYRKLNDDRPKVLADILYSSLEASGHYQFQRGHYVASILEEAFLSLACCGKGETC